MPICDARLHCLALVQRAKSIRTVTSAGVTSGDLPPAQPQIAALSWHTKTCGIPRHMECPAQVSDPELQPRLSPRPEDDAVFLHGILEGLSDIEARIYGLLARLGATPLKRVRT